MEFFKKKRVLNDGKDTFTVSTPSNNSIIEKTLSDVFSFANLLKTKKINLLTIGDDEYGATIQVRAWDVNSSSQITDWLDRSLSKVKKMSWVQIEITGHDDDRDHRSGQFNFEKATGTAFLDLCVNSGDSNTPINKLITLALLSTINTV